MFLWPCKSAKTENTNKYAKGHLLFTQKMVGDKRVKICMKN